MLLSKPLHLLVLSVLLFTPPLLLLLSVLLPLCCRRCCCSYATTAAALDLPPSLRQLCCHFRCRGCRCYDGAGSSSSYGSSACSLISTEHCQYVSLQRLLINVPLLSHLCFVSRTVRVCESTNLLCLLAGSLCCFPAHTHRAGQAGRGAVSLLQDTFTQSCQNRIPSPSLNAPHMYMHRGRRRPRQHCRRSPAAAEEKTAAGAPCSECPVPSGFARHPSSQAVEAARRQRRCCI